MKINYIIPFNILTGGIRVAFLYGNYLSTKGHDVIFYIPLIPYKTNKSLFKCMRFFLGNIKRGTKVSWLKCNFKIKLVPLIRDEFVRDADVTIATSWPTSFDVYNLNCKKGKKVYFIQDYEIWYGEKKVVDKTYTLDINRIVITKGLQELLKEKFNVESKVIYNGLNKNEFINEEKVNTKNKVILMLYNEAPNKGTKEGIKILKNIKNKYDVKIVLFGFKKGNDIPQNFEFYENPERSLLMKLYREASIYLFPSKNESWGMPVMEAMSNKCAVVGNNVGCLKEIGVNEYNCLSVNNLDYNDIQIKIENLLKDDKLLKKIQENAYITSEKFVWENSYLQMEEYFQNLLDGR